MQDIGSMTRAVEISEWGGGGSCRPENKERGVGGYAAVLELYENYFLGFHRGQLSPPLATSLMTLTEAPAAVTPHLCAIGMSLRV